MEMVKKHDFVVSDLSMKERLVEYLCYIGRNVAPSTFMMTGSHFEK